MSKTKEERGSNWEPEQRKLKWIFARPWVVATLILGAILFIWGLTRLCNEFNFCGKDNEFIRYLGWTLAGILSAWGVWVANRRAKAMEKSAEAQAEAVKAQADAVETQAKAVRATEAGHRQQRFRDAVAHLGDEQPSVRMGGVHALFHLACEEDDLRASIADILCSHLRATTGEEQYKQKYEDKPSTEVQSIMELLFTSTKTRTEPDEFWQDLIPDLSEAWLRGLALPGARLRGAYLMGAQLQGSNLRGAQFQRARLMKAQFQGAYLRGVQFQGANLWKAQLQGSNLRGAQFQGAYLGGAQFQGVRLLDTKFQGAQSKFNYEISRWWRSDVTFEERIREFIDKPGDLSEVALYGGLSDEDVENIMNSIDAYVPAENKQEIEKRLKTHVGERRPDKEKAMIKNMEQRGALGQYGKDEAEAWIKEYYKALRSKLRG